MKKFLPALFVGGLLAGGVALLPLTAAGTELTAVGARDAAGERVDGYKIVDGTGSTRAQGRFEKGKMEGTWSFFDTRHVKVAEITYYQGVPFGPYKTYFGSKYDPAAAGKLESEGTIQNDALVGHHTAYDAEGKVTSRAFFDPGDASQGKADPEETVVPKNGGDSSGKSGRAREAARLDVQFIHAIDAFIHPAVQ